MLKKDEILIYDRSKNFDNMDIDVCTPQECADLFGKLVKDGNTIYYPNRETEQSKYGKVWIHRIRDCGENEGGYFCEVYEDEEQDDRVDYFCIHPEDCDCTNENEVEKFIKWYAQMYQ